jgi:hypothetical protein
MTIEEILNEIDRICDHLPDSAVGHGQEITQLTQDAKDELKGALVIPEGWWIDDMVVTRSGINGCTAILEHEIHCFVSGDGDTYDEALRNALEQIKDR